MITANNTGKVEPLYRVQAIERALDILDCFTFEKKELGLFEIVHQTGLNKTTAKRMLSNLTQRNYLHQDAKTKRYRLGLRLFELGGIVFSSFSLRKATAHFMDTLQKETRATVLLGVMMEEQLVYIDKREGNGMIRISSEIGWRRPLHFGMLGMVLMAYMDLADVDVILSKYPLLKHTPHSITDFLKFKQRLENIRKKGYVKESGEAVEGVTGIAAPIRDYTRDVIAALGIAMPFGQEVSEQAAEELERHVKEICEAISSDLGYPGR